MCLAWNYREHTQTVIERLHDVVRNISLVVALIMFWYGMTRVNTSQALNLFIGFLELNFDPVAIAL